MKDGLCRGDILQMAAVAVGATSLGWPFAAAAAERSSGEKKYAPGVTDIEIKIGQTMPYSGPLSPYGSIGRAEVAYFKTTIVKS